MMVDLRAMLEQQLRNANMVISGCENERCPTVLRTKGAAQTQWVGVMRGMLHEGGHMDRCGASRYAEPRPYVIFPIRID